MCYRFVATLDEPDPFYRDGFLGVFASRSRRALRRRSILICRCSASSSTIFRTMRVVLSIGVSALGVCVLNTLVFVSFAKWQSPLWFHPGGSEQGRSNQCQVFEWALDIA